MKRFPICEMFLLAAILLMWTCEQAAGQAGAGEGDAAAAEVAPADPCENVVCNEVGERCVEGSCVCAETCDPDWESGNRQICVNKEFTYNHICDWHRHRCACRRGTASCLSEYFSSRKVGDDSFIYYYGPCKNLAAECNWELWKNSMHFTLTDWLEYLFNYKWSVPATLDRDVDDTLVRPFNSKARSKAQALTLDTSDARKRKIVSYWFCEIDRNNDGNLNYAEIARLTQILLPSNPCMDQFFSSCVDKSTLSYADWGTCFKLEPTDKVNCADYSD